MRYIVFSFFLFSLAIDPVLAVSKLDSLLIELDNAIKQEKQYTDQKENYINKIKQQLDNPNLNDGDRYQVYQNLTKEYEFYICDSAKFYSSRSVSLAEKINNLNWTQESKIQFARIQAEAGMFANATDILGSIKREELTPQQLITYYKAYSDTYIYWIEYQEGYDIDMLVKKRNDYQDSILQIAPEDSYAYAINFSTKYIELRKFDKAEDVLFAYFPTLKPDTREYSIYTSILAYFHEQKNQREKQKEYLAMSAISDVRASVKENLSLRSLAILLFEDGDINRANFYIKKSMEDANFYNARLRNIQISKVLPIIDKAYQLDKEKQQNKLRILLITVSVLSFILLLAIYFVFRQIKKLSKAQKEILEINTRLNDLNENLQLANEQQRQTNITLAEADHIKEQFISSFLEICTEYIERFDAFKITVNRKIKAGQVSDILKITSSTEDSARELKELYNNFDKAFLNIYPNFVEEFNKLLREEEHYPVNNKSLNQELRIFALIRLGITDSNKIATFLHYTLRTIYNYRSKVKSKAINQDDDFEEKVKHLCSAFNK